MKKIYLTIQFLIFTVFAFGQFGKIKENPKAYIGKMFRIDTVRAQLRKYGYDRFAWDVTKHTLDGGNVPFATTEHPTSSAYSALVNKVFTCIDAGEDKYLGGYSYKYLKLQAPNLGIIYYRYQYKYDLNELQYLVNIEEEVVTKAKTADGARSLKNSADSLNNIYTGKPLWLRSGALITYTTLNGKFTNIHDDNLRFMPVMVDSVGLAISHLTPFRIYIRTSTGLRAFFNFEERKGLWYGEASGGNERQHLDQVLYLKDPVKIYKLSAADLQTIKKGVIRLGMRRDIVRLIKGDPNKINNTYYGNNHDEQWVYYNSYYYFTNGILKTVQN
ncbi:hypothetical protein [Mucilaginibacter myungsuensis]|uniref:Uncharacterized protein n=1 Tax=Mucilaginibacter myungsuensis TaxID=649104 RepID=A0A929L2G6_9SPHI|nr:hypothetical protein [Mucilaginibacter myungsuensis]MBE9662011.1 hypothetical protein [Mucilaginibacter myungsuensis]MDN3599556.1 hypothetical protein [Mucilaginibacter myungsuensis]